MTPERIKELRDALERLRPLKSREHELVCALGECLTEIERLRARPAPGLDLCDHRWEYGRLSGNVFLMNPADKPDTHAICDDCLKVITIAELNTGPK